MSSPTSVLRYLSPHPSVHIAIGSSKRQFQQARYRMCTGRASTSQDGTTVGPLQNCYELAKTYLTPDRTISAEGVRKIAAAIDAIDLRELGIGESQEDQAQQASSRGVTGFFGRMWNRGNPEVSTSGRRPGVMTYMHIHEDPTFSMGVFCLPRGASIPLHDHPSMTVFSRVLYGKMHVRSFDWTQQQQQQRYPPRQRQAKLYTDSVVQASDAARVLHPHSGGNIHSFTGVTDCAVLDLLTPPYSRAEGRDCTYYKEVAPLQKDGTTLLKVSQPPAEFFIDDEEYKGRRIQVTREVPVDAFRQ